MLSPLLSLTLFTFYFLVSRAWEEYSFLYFFSFITGRAKYLSRQQYVAALCSSCGPQKYQVSRTVTSSFVCSWTISVTIDEGIQDP